MDPPPTNRKADPGAAGTDGSTFTSFRHRVSGSRHPDSILHPAPSFLALFLLLTAATALSQPVITQQPQSCTNAQGTTATFTVAATGAEPLVYQWQKLGAAWTDLSGCTDLSLCLTNVQTSQAGDYRAVASDTSGTTTSAVATLTVVVAPRITPTAGLQHSAVFLGQVKILSVMASGTPPLSYQWFRDGTALVDKTNLNLVIAAAQPTDEGNYTVVVTNLGGMVASEPARLWVVPPLNSLIRGNFTNATGQGLPYFYSVPTNYTALRSYPLILLFHGTGDDVNVFPTRQIPERLLFSSYQQQATDPAVTVYPTRWYAGEDWTALYLQLTSGLLDQMISQLNIDTNRVIVGGYSQGVHAAWDLLAMRPGFFAAADMASGWQGNAAPAAIKNVPLWVACARNDDAGQLGNTQTLVRSLRLAGGNPIYTEYNTGGHLDGILMHVRTPALINWCLAQRRSVAPTNEPLLSITSPTSAPTNATGAMTVNLAGSAAALGEAVTAVTWQNLTYNRTGTATGSNAWSATSIPLIPNRANVITVTATTTSWAPAYGGNTSFNDSLYVIQSPLRVTLRLQGANAVLNWTGGGPPYRVERATDLATDDWAEVLPDATPPVLLPLPLPGPVNFYRVVGQ